jgi:protein LSM14
MPSVVNNKPVVLPDSSVASPSSDKPDSVLASVSTYQPSKTPPDNIASSAVSVAESIALVSPGQLLPTNSSTSSQTMQTTAAPPSKPPSVVASSQTASTVPSSHPTSSVVSHPQTASATVPSSRQLELRNENKEGKQIEQKAKQHLVAPTEIKEPLLPAPKPILQKVVF